MDDRSDAVLVQQARAGDQAAFVALVERHTPLLRPIARRMVGHPDLTDDLVQETVGQAYAASITPEETQHIRQDMTDLLVGQTRA